MIEIDGIFNTAHALKNDGDRHRAHHRAGHAVGAADDEHRHDQKGLSQIKGDRRKGGDEMGFFGQSDTIYTLDYKVRNAMIDFFKKVDTLKPEVDGRFTQLN